MANDNIGQEVAITASEGEVTVGNRSGGFSFVNSSAKDIFFRGKDKSSTFEGTAAELVAAALGGARLRPGEVTKRLKGETYQVVCATGETATLRVVPGEFTVSPAEVGPDLVYTITAINEAAGATIDLGGNVAAKYARLHELVITMDAAGTATVKDDSDGAGGGTPVAQSGDYALGANGGVNIPFRSNVEGCLKSSVVNRHMTLVTTEGCNGYAIVSSGD